MLITIVGTKDYGKFVLHKYPYEEIHVQQEGFQRLPFRDMQQTFADKFDYFAIYRKNELIRTSTKSLPQKAVVEIFGANQKSSQVVLGIDDDCVLVSRSVFLNRRTKSLLPSQVAVSDSAMFMDYHEDNESIINSVSVIWRQESFEHLQDTKHHLSFLLGMLEVKQRHSNFLTKQIRRIMEQNQIMAKRIRDLLTVNNRDNTQPLEQIRIKMLAKEIYEWAKKVRQDIPLFRILKQYYNSWTQAKNFKVQQNDAEIWEGTIGKQMIVGQPPKQFIQQIQHKTLAMVPKKLTQYLPNVLYTDRVKKLYEKGFAFNSLSFKKLLQKSVDLNEHELYHTAYFLLRNNLAVDIYPINYPHSYNLYCLKDLPSRQSIQKMNQRIFLQKNVLQVLLTYSKYKIVKNEQTKTLIYFLSKDTIGEVKVYIYKKCETEQQDIPSSQQANQNLMLEQLLNKYNMCDKDLNYLLSVEPNPFGSKENTMLSSLIKFIKDRHSQWGFFFIQ